MSNGELKMSKTKSNFIVLFFFIAIFLILSSITLLSVFSPYDEIWNFQNIFKMYHGGTIYTNNNVIDTPIFFTLGNVLFHIFGANLLTFRVYNILIYLLKYVFIFALFRKFGTHRILAIFYLLIWLCFEYTYISCGANYNQLGLVFCLLGTLWYFGHAKNKFYHVVQGILLFFIFFTKQTIGIYYAFGIILFELFKTGFGKEFFKNQGMKLASFLPCLLISLLTMFLKGNLMDFINLCFGSILEFGASNHSFHVKAIKYLIFMIFTIGFSIFVLTKLENVPKDKKQTIVFLLCLAIGMSFNMLPLINGYHVNMALLFYYLLFIYMIDTFLIQELLISKKQLSIVLSICFVILFCMLGKTLFTYFSGRQTYQSFDKTHPFYNAPVLQEDLNRIQTITNYIENKKKSGTQVVILSYEAASFMVPLKQNNGALDLAFSGNLGYHGIKNTIKQISEMKNTEFMIFTNNDDCFFQEASQIREYITRHFEKIGNLLNYSIYINN